MDNKARIYNVYSILKILQNIMCIFDTLIITLINPVLVSHIFDKICRNQIDLTDIRK